MTVINLFIYFFQTFNIKISKLGMFSEKFNKQVIFKSHGNKPYNLVYTPCSYIKIFYEWKYEKFRRRHSIKSVWETFPNKIRHNNYENQHTCYETSYRNMHHICHFVTFSYVHRMMKILRSINKGWIMMFAWLSR